VSHAAFLPESVRHHWAPQFRPNTLPPATLTIPTRKTKTTLRVEPLQQLESFPFSPPISSIQKKAEWHAEHVQGLDPLTLSTSLGPKPHQLSAKPPENLTSRHVQPPSPKPFVLPFSSLDTQREAAAAAHRALILDKLTSMLPPTFSPSTPRAERQTLGCAEPAMATSNSPHSRPSYRFPCRSSSCLSDPASVPGHDCIFDTNIWLRKNPSPRTVYGGSSPLARAMGTDGPRSALSRSGRAGIPTGPSFLHCQDGWSHEMCSWLNERQDIAQQTKEAEDKRPTAWAPPWAHVQAREKGKDYGLVVKKTHHPESEIAVPAQPYTPSTQHYLSNQTPVAELPDERLQQFGRSLHDLFVEAYNRHASQKARFQSSAEFNQEGLQDQAKGRHDSVRPDGSAAHHDFKFNYIPVSPHTRSTYGLEIVYPSVDQHVDRNGRSAYTSHESKSSDIPATVEASKPRKRDCQPLPSPAHLQQGVAGEDKEYSSSTSTSPVLTPNSTRPPSHMYIASTLEDDFRMLALGSNSLSHPAGPAPTRLPSRASSPPAIAPGFDIDFTVPGSPSSDTYPHDADLDYEVLSYEEISSPSSTTESEDDFPFEYEVVDTESRSSSPLSVSSGLQ